MNKKIKILLIAGVVILLVAGSLLGYAFWKKSSMNVDTELRIGFITDWEYHSREDIGNKLTAKAPEEMEKAVKYLNEEFQPKIVVSGGDMIESSGVKPIKAINQLREMNGIFSKLTAQRGYVFGNHDLRVLNKEQLRQELGMQDNHSYFDLDDWRFVLMDTNFKKEDGTDLGPNNYNGGFVGESEFNWLKVALDSEKPTIIFSHHSPMPKPDSRNLLNQKETRAFLEQFPNVVAVISGHDPGFRLIEEKGINYVIVNNLVNNKALGSFATIKANYNQYTKKAEINLEQHGMQRGEIGLGRQLERKKDKWTNWFYEWFLYGLFLEK